MKEHLRFSSSFSFPSYIKISIPKNFHKNAQMEREREGEREREYDRQRTLERNRQRQNRPGEAPLATL
jgi:hypothetical protein